MYFDKITTDKEQYTNINHIKIDEQGELSEYPKDFLDEWSNQLLKLI
jgi:predicted ATPase